MLYFDAAFIAKFYLQEPESEAVRALTENSPGVVSLVIGRLETELVFSRKLREGALTAAAQEALIAQFQIDCEDGLWSWLGVNRILRDISAAGISNGLPPILGRVSSRNYPARPPACQTSAMPPTIALVGVAFDDQSSFLRGAAEAPANG